MKVKSNWSGAGAGGQKIRSGLASLACALALVPWPGAASETPDIRRDATVRAVEEVMPSVVNIATKSIVPVRDPFEQLYRQMWHQRPYDEYYSLGSGVVIDETGYLLTNDHVVRRANQIAVRFGTGTNEYEATVVDRDPVTDIALLKLKGRPGEKFHAIKLAGEDDLLLGETVLALGNPLGLGGTVTRGILSSKSRMAPIEGEPLTYRNWLQTDAPINPGNSGGPLVNLRGELIGINVAVVSETPEGQPIQGIGFAIPIKLVEEADIFPTPFIKSSWFGARVKVGTYPLTLVSVQPQSPAERAGLEVGDEILEVDGKPPKSFIDFADMLATRADSDITLTVRREGNLREARLRMVPVASVFNAGMVRQKLGLSLEPVSLPGALRFSDDSSTGFAVTGVQKDSPAGQAGLQRGFVVRAVDSQTPPDLVALAKLLSAKKPGEPVQLSIAAPQQAGSLSIWAKGKVELVPR